MPPCALKRAIFRPSGARNLKKKIPAFGAVLGEYLKTNFDCTVDADPVSPIWGLRFWRFRGLEVLSRGGSTGVLGGSQNRKVVDFSYCSSEKDKKMKTERFFFVPGSLYPLQQACTLKRRSRFQAVCGPKRAKNTKSSISWS